jgi:DNA (cytosine-5)-methyltransferase 1
MNLKDELGAPDTHEHRKQTKFRQASLFDKGFKEPKMVQDILESSPDKKYKCTSDFTERLSRVVGSDFTKLHGVRLIDFRGGHSIHSWELGIKGECSPAEINFMNLLISNRRQKKFGRHQDGKSLTKEQILTFYQDDDFDEVSQSLVEKGYLSCKNGRYNPVSGNMSFEIFKFLDPYGISITLTASDANRLGVVQNNIPRRLTPRECARLQGYPDSYKLLDNDSAVYKQMGNAVSVPVVKAVLTDFLENNHVPSTYTHDRQKIDAQLDDFIEQYHPALEALKNEKLSH